MLASMGILNTKSSKFYPDNYLRHYDFVILFVNSLLVSENQQLPSLGGRVRFADVDASASYIDQLIYAADRGLIDYLITTRKGQLYFEPNDFITKKEVYHILSKSNNVQFMYNEQQADYEKITRGELADLLVKTFQFEPNQLTSSSLS